MTLGSFRNVIYKICLYMHKQILTLNSLQELICYKNPTNQSNKVNLFNL